MKFNTREIIIIFIFINKVSDKIKIKFIKRLIRVSNGLILLALSFDFFSEFIQVQDLKIFFKSSVLLFLTLFSFPTYILLF